MRKLIAVLILALVTGAVAQQFINAVDTTLLDTTGTTQYIGTAWTEVDSQTAVSTNDAKWQIIKIVSVGGNAVSIQTAITTNKGDKAQRSTAWANRASTNTFYK
jgi:hypothetical protein